MKTLANRVNRGAEIARLHTEIGNSLKMTLEHAIRIGELLTAQKTELKHGEWLPWIENNLPFSKQTANRYMTAWDRRGELKLLTVSNLTEAYKLLEAPKAGTAGRKKKARANQSRRYQLAIKTFRHLRKGLTLKQCYERLNISPTHVYYLRDLIQDFCLKYQENVHYS